ncbi:MAG: S24 family peptidase [Pseudomonadota bacterium]
MSLFRLVKVEGDSMARQLPHGSYALFFAAWRLCSGQIVLVQHPKYNRIVKQITTCDHHGVGLRGLNDQSTSEHDLGVVPREAVKGVLIWSIKPISLPRKKRSITEGD